MYLLIYNFNEHETENFLDFITDDSVKNNDPKKRIKLLETKIQDLEKEIEKLNSKNKQQEKEMKKLQDELEKEKDSNQFKYKIK